MVKTSASVLLVPRLHVLIVLKLYLSHCFLLSDAAGNMLGVRKCLCIISVTPCSRLLLSNITL